MGLGYVDGDDVDLLYLWSLLHHLFTVVPLKKIQKNGLTSSHIHECDALKRMLRSNLRLMA